MEVSPSDSVKSSEVEEQPEGGSGGAGGHRPRIKHVCRRASVALGQRALFPGQPQLRLSALPSLEKEKLLQLEERRPGELEKCALLTITMLNYFIKTPIQKI